MNRYKLEVGYSVHHNGKFSHNLDRTLTIYATTKEVAKEWVKPFLRKGFEYKMGKLAVLTSDETIITTLYEGAVQHDCEIRFVDAEGKQFNITNTLRYPMVVASWIHRIISEEGVGRIPVLVKVTERLEKEDNEGELPF